MDLSRITLRPFNQSDAEDILSWIGDDRVTKSDRMKTLKSKEEALSFIGRESTNLWRRSICIEDRSIGMLTVYLGSDDEACRGEIGYALAVEYWGKGITTRAVEMAVPKVFDEFPQIVRLQGMTNVENKGSRRVLEKAGFKMDGLMRKYFYLKGQIQDVVYSVLSPDSD
ncbi:hypothetical protein ABFS82_14G041000 [Erythranthe guttata]|uniref:N-acetyltransferase domain-containing protein n=1 Tax=Erythranthe guttata TaxID=4155 RepID=A0A022QZH5_ERYGU|nr:PREDICTED: uncharacterized protein LOC105963305 [Erythranthe guttata]EYU32738.1 hypothetical protein MIMGU_mgv1a022954mg [Erythranthe guttata]|eukprot:XP_012843152.1 PREDICTED: uncharacterized protein LOC105963305 [Erythranthe guttata]